MPYFLLRSLFVCFCLLITLQGAHAACTFAPPTAGNDDYTCDSDTAPTLVDNAGNNSLTMPTAGTGSITGPVSFGTGNDRVVIGGGTIHGDVDEGSGTDNFTMTGGQIQSLHQGDGLDTFEMSGGVIADEFEDGDKAHMTGGTIGRVDMKLDDNLFDMDGGTIVGNLVTGFGKDTILVKGGTIGGNISVSGGDDQILVSDGTIHGEIRMSAGADVFNWRDAGIIHGAIVMELDDDRALLDGLSDATLSSTPAVDGGEGNDQLTFQASTPINGARYVNWESVSLTQGTQLTLNDNLVLGDAGTGTGTLDIDASSSLSAHSGVVTAFTAGQNVTLTNAGTINLTSGGAQVDDRFTVVGNYIGNNGHLKLHSILADDDSPSDRLVVSRGTLSGTTAIEVSNFGGGGAQTLQNGIQVVEANQGATSSANAFSLAGSVSAGAFDYYLFKGGVTAGTENNWYLRSSVTAPVVPLPEPEGPVTPLPEPGGPDLPTPEPGETIPFYRPEVPIDAVVTPAAAQLAQTALGTFHERQGEQGLLRENGELPAGWARTFASHGRRSWSGDVNPSLDSTIWGFQVGHDLFGSTSTQGYRQHAGLFLSHARLDGDVRGFIDGFQDREAGNLRLNGDSLGAYWTLIGPTDWYIDTVAMGTRYTGSARSDRGVKLDLKGHAVTLSVESGYPLPLSERWAIEPQVQLIGQKVSMNNDEDGISQVGFDTQEYLKGRIGVRAKGPYHAGSVPLELYVRGNLWHDFKARDTATFDDYPIKTEHTGTTLDFGAGVVATLSRDVDLYSSIDYGSNIDTRQQEAVSATIGLRMRW
ncbi:autotransporter outer membrane beta-barrel domain-containing protein [Pseudomonas agarici]|uniref:Autotransporter outer membrane beta-barrel domain-containing protein n=1 Tax=Pseudomonas agarici TaxID=46677 RepID=A0A0X1SYD4_PSEAA|nr:autotransporter domain-containing protein [Pseudomonas agarici]AMB84845.1 autotransporter outer membrane beta-barrel domain-containing protein [Pseudomonas agarici]NWB90121.1 autotransporter domain-containing protein [Pseudomonas agarici]NWC09915.1 autotransporter domain-containing protein [Pseudomonas agarici]SEL56819.1 Type V secretory pathway, adhesin AidA [Pseudomonas agarici]